MTNSAPGATAWYNLVNSNTLEGMGLPAHPWVGDTYNDEIVSNTTPPIAHTLGTCADARDEPKTDHECDAESHGVHNRMRKAKNDDEQIRVISSVANKDEWSAALVGVNLVQSLVNSLQALLDADIAAPRGLERTEALAAKLETGKSWNMKSNASTQLAGEVTTSDKQMPGPDKAVIEVPTDDCLGCEIETAQVEILLALGSLLSAHPLAARDRFQLAGGALRVHRIVSRPKPDRDETHACLCSGMDGAKGATAALASTPFLHEHCCLVALQVLRLRLRLDSNSEAIPLGVIEGAARLVDALAPVVRGVCDKYSGGRPRSINAGPPGRDHEGPQGGEGHAGANGGHPVGLNGKNAGSALSRQLLPLVCPGEMAIEEKGKARDIWEGAEENKAFADASWRAKSRYFAADAQCSPSYRLCG